MSYEFLLSISSPGSVTAPLKGYSNMLEQIFIQGSKWPQTVNWSSWFFVYSLKQRKEQELQLSHSTKWLCVCVCVGLFCGGKGLPRSTYVGTQQSCFSMFYIKILSTSGCEQGNLMHCLRWGVGILPFISILSTDMFELHNLSIHILQ